MSGVYFPKLRLPEMCKDCDLILDLKASMYCPISGKFVGFDDTPEMAGCPGIPVPGHGRLIDADAAYDKIAEEAGEEAGNYVDMDVVGMGLEYTPTIIPADKEGEE